MTPTEVEAGQCAPVFYYYHSDHLGSSNVLTDRNGDVVRHYENYAYGKERYNDQACSFEVSNKYTGQILDEETGLYYYNARYYDPELGRFIQPDTIVPSASDPQSLNRYSYVNNNPLKYVDPSGSFFFLTPMLAPLIGAGVGAAVASARNQNITLGALTGGIMGGLAGLGGSWVQAAAVGAAGGALPPQAQTVVITAYAAAVLSVLTNVAFGALWAIGPATLGETMAWAGATSSVTAPAAALTSGIMSLPPVARSLDRAGFGVRLGVSFALTLVFQLAIADLLYAGNNSVKIDDYINEQVDPNDWGSNTTAARAELRDQINQEARTWHGTIYGTSPSGRAPSPVSRVILNQQGQRVGATSTGLFGEHTGAVYRNVPFNINLGRASIPQGYLLWGISHQTVGTTALQAGYAGSILNLGTGFTRYLSSAVYGPYGGGLFQAAYNLRGEL